VWGGGWGFFGVVGFFGLLLGGCWGWGCVNTRWLHCTKKEDDEQCYDKDLAVDEGKTWNKGTVLTGGGHESRALELCRGPSIKEKPWVWGAGGTKGSVLRNGTEREYTHGREKQGESKVDRLGGESNRRG